MTDDTPKPPSDSLIAWVATSNRRLSSVGLGLAGLAFVYGFAADILINRYSTSPALNIPFVALQFLWVGLGGWVLGAWACSAVFGDQWRRRSLRHERIEDEDAVEMKGFRDGPAMIWFAAFIGMGALWAGVWLATDDWIGRYNRGGAYVVALRSDNVSERTAALSDLVHPIRRSRSADEPVRDAIVGVLDDPDAEVRMRAAWACGLLVLVECRPGLVPMLDDADPGARREAAFALGRLADAQGERRLLELLPAAVGDDQRTIEILTGLGLMNSVEGARRAVALLGLVPAEVEVVALWTIGRARSTEFRDVVMALEPGEDLGRLCALAEVYKHVTTVDDDRALRGRFANEARGRACPAVEHRDLEFTEGRRGEDIVYVVGEDVREKYMRAVFNIAGDNLEEWLNEILYDEAEEMPLRLLAERMIKLLEGAPARLPREAYRAE